MTKRPGTTKKISISLDADILTALKKRARRLHEGNLSAVIAELAADAALLEGMQALLDSLGGATLTDEDRARIDAEWAGTPLPTKRSRKGSRSP